MTSSGAESETVRAAPDESVPAAPAAPAGAAAEPAALLPGASVHVAAGPTASAPVSAAAAGAASVRVAAAGEPILPEQSPEDTDAAWGEYRERADDRLYRDRPPHWDDF